jgi:hypothetical protein
LEVRRPKTEQHLNSLEGKEREEHVRTKQDPDMVTSSQATPTYYPHRPLWLRAVNTGGDILQRLGLSFGQFDVTRLMETACRQTGLHDFGTIPFQEPLQLLLHSCAHEAHLNLCGQMAVRHDILRLLRNRLCLEADWQRYPGIAAQCIDRPLFIAGLPRTGTSLLQGLLAHDPANRTPLSWEVMAPSPPLPGRRIRVIRVSPTSNGACGVFTGWPPSFSASMR